MQENDVTRDAKPAFVSANELQAKAEEMMLGGKPPETNEDWARCVNFWYANLEPVRPEAMVFLAKIIGCPLRPEQVVKIGIFQMAIASGLSPEDAEAIVDLAEVGLGSLAVELLGPKVL